MIMYYVAFSVIVLHRLASSSTLIMVPEIVSHILILAASIIFLVKIILDRHKFSELIATIALSLLSLYIYFTTGASFFLTTFLAIVAIKGVSLKSVIKLDVLFKSVFLFSHALLFLLDYIFGLGDALTYISESTKGTSYFLYFINPNTTGLIATWLAIDILYLYDNPKFKQFILPTILVIAAFLITRSRTPFYCYVLYLVLHFFKGEKTLTVAQKIIYPVAALASLIIVRFLSVDNGVFMTLNSVFSGRLLFSAQAFSETGMQVLPSAAGSEILENFIIDNFYVRCFIFYGLITLVLFYLPHLFLPKKGAKKAKRISIVTSVYLFFETALVNVGFGIPYLMLADSIVNRKDKNEAPKE
ncbi:hypothetical protein IJH02_02700 [Candidatus Saccharibacteria bacterium]|nr:hypothetical protein [Candidatus Saccharibacteria bacterium]